MKFQPLLPIWLVLPFAALLIGACVWRIVLVRAQRPMLLRWIRRGCMALMLTLMAVGISVPGGTSTPGVSNFDVIFAVDTTPSMGALDYAGNQKRLDGVKHDLIALDQQFKGAHVSLISFDSQATVILPFTTDTSAFQTAVATLTPQIYSYSNGSSIDEPLSLIVQQLKDSRTLNPQHSRFVFYMGDGEQTSDKPVKSFAPIAGYATGGGVLGYGTTKGAKMVKYTATGYASLTSSNPYILTPNDSGTSLVPAISKLDPDALTKMAKEMNVSYINRDAGGSTAKLFEASKASYTIDHTTHINRYLNLYWLFAIPFSGLLFWEWKDIVLKLFALHEHREVRHGK